METLATAIWRQTAREAIADGVQSIVFSRIGKRNEMSALPHRTAGGRLFASPIAAIGLDLVYGLETGGLIMSIARPFHVVMVFAAFLFIGAIVVGAL